MPISRMFTMYCDECWEEFDSDPWIGWMKEKARAQGWLIYGSKVLCPECRTL